MSLLGWHQSQWSAKVMVENAGLSMELIDSWNLNPLEQLGNLAVFEHPRIIWECFLPPLFPTFSACYLSILQRQGWTKLGASSAPRNSPPAPTSDTCHARRNHVAAACLKGWKVHVMVKGSGAIPDGLSVLIGIWWCRRTSVSTKYPDFSGAGS